MTPESEILELLGPAIISELFSPKNPKTKKPIHFELKPGQRVYLYFQINGYQFCYTPHADTEGNYWCWTYAPKGKGSRSGKPESLTMKRLIRCSKRKTAKSRALGRFKKMSVNVTQSNEQPARAEVTE